MQLHDWVRSSRTAHCSVAVALVLLVIAGCSGSGQPATETGQPTATQAQPPSPTRPADSAQNDEQTSSDLSGCELLTQAEVAAAMGQPVTGQEDSGLRGCEWKTGDRTQVLLDVYSGSTLAGNTCAAQRSLGIGREENVADLGDSALWKSDGWLVVCTSRAVIAFNIDNSPNSPDQDKEAAINMARSVLGRL